MKNITIDCKYEEDLEHMEEALDVSDNLVKEPKVKFYSNATNARRKTYTKSRRCVVCNKFSVAYYECCDKTFCYAVGGKKHKYACLIDHIKMKKREGRRGRKPSHIV